MDPYQVEIRRSHPCVRVRSWWLRQELCSPTARTSQQIVDDLHALLTNAHIEGPYVLVGHSFGGLNVILYASQYPEEVAGVVLVDSVHPDQDARFLAVLPPESPDESSTLAAFGKI